MKRRLNLQRKSQLADLPRKISRSILILKRTLKRLRIKMRKMKVKNRRKKMTARWLMNKHPKRQQTKRI